MKRYTNNTYVQFGLRILLEIAACGTFLLLTYLFCLALSDFETPDSTVCNLETDEKARSACDTGFDRGDHLGKKFADKDFPDKNMLNGGCQEFYDNSNQTAVCLTGLMCGVTRGRTTGLNKGQHHGHTVLAAFITYLLINLMFRWGPQGVKKIYGCLPKNNPFKLWFEGVKEKIGLGGDPEELTPINEPF